MTSDEIFDLIEQVAANSGKNVKIALLAAYEEDDHLMTVLKHAYHPLTTYGVRKMRAVTRHGTGHFTAENTWLMLEKLASRRLSGTAALDAIEAEQTRLTPKSASLLHRIITKDMRAGFDAETVNKVWKGLVPDFPYMRCSLPKHVKLDEFFEHGAISQVKADGTYANVDITADGEIRISTRQGNEYPLTALEPLLAEIRQYVRKGTQLHGELLLLRDGQIIDRADGNGVFTHIREGGDFAANERPLFLAWDQIPLEAAVPKGSYKKSYAHRLVGLCLQLLQGCAGLKSMNEVLKQPAKGQYLGIVESRFVKNMDEAMAHYKANLARGLEGSVVKKYHAIWKDGTSREQIKLKLKVPVELRIEGFIEGNGKYTGMLGAFKMRSECGALKVDVNARGDAQRAHVWANRDKFLDKVATVEGNAICAPSDSNPDHSLYLPVLVEIRDDKSIADTLERIREQFEAAVSA
jgi:DNA ligase-1